MMIGKYTIYAILILMCSEISSYETVQYACPNVALSSSTDQVQSCTENDFVNLGVDYTDDEIPETLKNALIDSVNSDSMLNQYSPNNGQLRLLKVIAKLYSKMLNKKLSENHNVLVTVGATEGLHVAILGLTSPGDEWIVIEPFYTRYVPMITIAHGVPRFTTLKQDNISSRSTGSDWKLDKEELESLFNRRTKGIIINNPNNPTGKLFTLDELQFIAELSTKWDTYVISDEAHEWIIYEPNTHIKIASLPGMFERTITIGSASKTFSVTGWRIGWIYGPSEILNHLKFVHSNSVHSAPAPQQAAISVGFEEELRNFGKEGSYFVSRGKAMEQKRQLLLTTFLEIGMTPTIPEAGNCVIVDWTTMDNLSKINFEAEAGADKSTKFNNWMVKNIGVLGVPIMAFYSAEHKQFGENHIRYCFHKKNETIEKAVKNLLKLKSYTDKST